MESSTDTSLAMGACPPLEDIAAFLDGTLSKEERDRIVAHLADCAICYDVFAGAADFQLTSAQADQPKGKVTRGPFGSKKKLPWWLIPAAAAALVVLALGLGLKNLTTPPERALAELIHRIFGTPVIQPELALAGLVQPVAGGSNISPYLYPAATYRGEETAGDYYSLSHSFMAGVFDVDLSLAVRAKDASAASDRLHRIGIQVRSFLQSDDLANQYSRESSKLHDAPPASADALLGQIGSRSSVRREKLRENATSREFFSFGEWAEAGRIAAKAQAPRFFQDGDHRRFLRWILRNQKEDLDQEVIQGLQQIQDAWKDEGLQPADYSKLEKQLSRIIEYYERQSEQSFEDIEP